MNKFSLITLLLVAICVVLLSSNTIELKRLNCGKFCLKSALDNKIEGSTFPSCFSQCLSMSKHTKDDTSELMELIKQVKETLNNDIQKEEAVLVNEEEEKVESDSFSSAPASGTYMTVTASALNIRSSASTSASILRTVSSGTVLKFTGYVATRNGYTWYGVRATDGSFSGTGYAASNFLKVGGSSAPTQSSNRKYPLFKQCNSKWKYDKISTKTVCQVGCLMSSVSMALNGLGKRLSNGKSANPGTLNAWLKAHGGYSGNLFIWGSVSRYGLSYKGQPTSRTTIRNYVKSSRHIVILNVNSGGHWVLATGLTSSGYTVNDPGYKRSTYSNSQVVRAGVYSF